MAATETEECGRGSNCDDMECGLPLDDGRMGQKQQQRRRGLQGQVNTAAAEMSTFGTAGLGEYSRGNGDDNVNVAEPNGGSDCGRGNCGDSANSGSYLGRSH